MVEGARLESVYTVTPYRGFESLSLRQIHKGPIGAFCVFDRESGSMRTLRFDNLSKKDWTAARSNAAPQGRRKQNFVF